MKFNNLEGNPEDEHYFEKSFKISSSMYKMVDGSRFEEVIVDTSGVFFLLVMCFSLLFRKYQMEEGKL